MDSAASQSVSHQVKPIQIKLIVKERMTDKQIDRKTEMRRLRFKRKREAEIRHGADALISNNFSSP